MRIALCVAMVLAVSSVAHAGPFGRSRSVARSSESVCLGGQCGQQAQATVRQKTVVRTSGSAQAHAESMAASGSLVHAANHGSTYEGVGVGSSPQSALGACCNNGGRVIEEGVAFGHGRWFACRRYSLR